MSRAPDKFLTDAPQPSEPQLNASQRISPSFSVALPVCLAATCSSSVLAQLVCNAQNPSADDRRSSKHSRPVLALAQAAAACITRCPCWCWKAAIASAAVFIPCRRNMPTSKWLWITERSVQAAKSTRAKTGVRGRSDAFVAHSCLLL